MTNLPHGEFRGLTWYEVPVAACGYEGKRLPEGTTGVAIMAPLGKFLYPTVEAAALATPDKVNFAAKRIAFLPFTDETIDGRPIMYNRHDFDSESVTAWAQANLDIPEELDLTFDYNGYGYAMHVVATTERNGSVVKIRKKLDTELPLVDALAQHMPFLLAKCPRPQGNRAEFTCASFTAGILSTITKHGADQVEAWLERLRKETARNVPTLVLPGAVFACNGIVSQITLSKDDASNIVRAEATLRGGHTLKDDQTGVEVVLHAQLPATVRTSLRGRSLGDVVDAEWAKGLRIRTVREPDEKAGTISLRAFGENVPLEVGSAPDWTDEEAEEHVRAGGRGEWPSWQSVQATAIPILRQLTRQQLASVVSVMAVQDRFDLAQFGHDGWVLRRQGYEIIVDKCPAVPYGDFVADLLETER